MSLIATTFSNEMPFIIGDLLFSSEEGRPGFLTPTQIPTQPRTLGYNPKLLPYWLWQKIYIISDRLAIALAGDYYEMKSFLRELKLRMAVYDVIGKEEILQFVKDFDLPANFSQSVLLMLLVTPQDDEMNYVHQFFQGGFYNLDDRTFGKILAAGSGAKDFLYQFSAPAESDVNVPIGTFNHALILNVGLLAKWLAIEKSSGHTLNDHWGSGFEMIYFDGSKFVKLKEIAFVIFEGRSNENGITAFAFPTVIIYMRYDEEVLIITSLNLGNGSWSFVDDHVSYTTNSVEATLFEVMPLDESVSNERQKEDVLSFETNIIGAGYSILNHEQGIFTPSYFLKDGLVSVKFQHGLGIEVKVPKDINEAILAGAKNAFDFEKQKARK